MFDDPKILTTHQADGLNERQALTESEKVAAEELTWKQESKKCSNSSWQTENENNYFNSRKPSFIPN